MNRETRAYQLVATSIVGNDLGEGIAGGSGVRSTVHDSFNLLLGNTSMVWGQVKREQTLTGLAGQSWKVWTGAVAIVSRIYCR